MRPPAEGRPIVLVGFMAAGKSAVGRALAERLGWDLVDTDALVQRLAGRPVAAIFADLGEERFRAFEAEVLGGLVGRRRCVIATGGGAFAAHATRSLLAATGRTVWLDLPFEVVLERLQAGDRALRSRPLARGADPVALRALFERRRAAYALAELRIAADRQPPGAIAEAILEAIGQTSC